MPIATELSIAQTTDASLVAETIFGPGITVVSSTLSGSAGQTGIYSNGLTTSPGVVPSDSGVIFSTGNVADFTNSTGTTDTNTQAGTTTIHNGAGDADLTATSGVQTFDAVVFEAVFIPDNDFLTMQFVFSSEEYLEYVNGGYNDIIAVMVNGTMVELTPTGDTVSIDTVNTSANSNLYVNNPAASDPFNTEMDGFTITMAFKAPVNIGVENTIKIGFADGGDAEYDSNFLIAADSLQTVAIAFADEIELLPNTPGILDVLANDADYSGQGLTVTKINDVSVVPGDTVTVGTGESITLNPDGTLTVLTDGDLTATTFTYEVTDGNGITDVGYVTATTAAAPDPDGYVDGTVAGDLIDVAYTGDPQGDRVDNNDSLGVLGTSGDGDVINGFAGNDTIRAGADDDIVFGGSDADVIEGGSGNDTLDGGIGFSPITYRDVANGQNAFGGSGNDYFRWLAEPASNATISLDAGFDGDRTGDGVADYILVATTNTTNTLNIRSFDYGLDKIVLPEPYAGLSMNTASNGGNQYSVKITITYTSGNTQSFNIEGAGTVPTPASIFTTTGPESGLTANDTIAGGDGDDLITGNDGDDVLYGGDGDLGTPDDATGSDSLYGGTGNDSLFGEAGNDVLLGEDGNDTLEGGTGDDLLTGGDGDDVFVYTPGDGIDTISDFNVGNTGTLTDGDRANNDFVDLSAYYDDIWELTADYRDDGILNQSNDGVGGADYSDNTQFGAGGLVFTNGVASTSFFNVENTGVVCFVSGTRILTDTGERVIDTLRVGDRIVTRDNGVQVLRWIGRRTVSAADLARNPKLLPIQLSPELTGGDDVLAVSPQHGVLLNLNGEETLVRATHLAGLKGGSARVKKGCRTVTYLHLMFDQHQIVFANGAASESFYPGPLALAAAIPAARREIFAVFPGLDLSDVQTSYGASVRRFAARKDLPGHLRNLKHCGGRLTISRRFHAPRNTCGMSRDLGQCGWS
jgi:hypothetical protein